MNPIRSLGFIFLSVIAFGLNAQSVLSAEVSGEVRYTGILPEPQIINMGSDKNCVKAHDKPVYDPSLVVNETGGVKNAFVYIKEGLEEQVFETPEEAVMLNQKGCMYEPRVFGIQVGQKLNLMNSDATLHNIHSQSQETKPFNLGMPITGMVLTKKFTAPEIMVPIKCDVHAWMRAYAGVLEHPFFKVTNEQGHFEIENLPPGHYQIAVWHERLGTQESELVVSKEDKTKNVTFVFETVE